MPVCLLAFGSACSPEAIPVENRTAQLRQMLAPWRVTLSMGDVGPTGSLDIFEHSELNPQRIYQMLTHPGMTNVALLHFTKVPASGDAIFAALLSSPAYHLRFIHASNSGTTDAGAQALARFPHTTHLEAVSLEFNNIGPAGAVALAGSPHLASLSELSLTGNPLGNAGVIAISRGTMRDHLVQLGVGAVGLDDTGLKAVLTAQLPNLTRLSIGPSMCNYKGPSSYPADCFRYETLLLLRDSTRLPKLRYVRLGGASLVPAPIRDALKRARPGLQLQ